MILATGLLAALGAVPSVGASVQSKSALKAGDPCTYFTAKQVAKVFGGPVTIDVANPARRLFKATCDYDVGPSSQIGILTATLVYPLLPPPGQTAIDAIEADRATHAVLGANLGDAKVGTKSYLDLDTSKLTLVASKKLVFSLHWVATGAPADGAALTPKVQQQLTSLAKLVIARAPR